MAARPNQNSQLGIKFFLTTFSLTLVLGFWNLFARKAQLDQTGSNSDLLSAEPWSETTADEFVLPTLVPMAGSPMENDNAFSDTGDPTNPGDIREVVAPTPRPVIQLQNPVVEQVNSGQPQQSGQQPHPQPTSITTTGSSQ